MKILFTILLAFAIAASGCNRSGSTRAASEDRETDNMKREQDAYVSTMEAKLNEFDKKVDGLAERASTMKGTAKTDFDNDISRLREQGKEVSKKLSDIKSVSPQSWPAMKQEVDSAAAELERSYNQVSEKWEHAAVPSSQTPTR